MLRNLFSNAIKYSLPQTSIQVETKKNIASLTISIINQAQTSDSIKLQSSMDSAITSNSSGLGITLVKEFIAKLNGTFNYTVNNNTVTATITLPAA